MARRDTKELLENLLEYCRTETQLEYIKAVMEYGTHQEAAEKLGVGRRSLSETIKRVKGYAVEKGGLPTVGSPYHRIKGESILLGKDGKQKMKWVKTETDKEKRLQMFADCIMQTFCDYEGRSVLVDCKTKIHSDDIMCVIPIGDAHLGMRAWQEECGQNFDLKVAQDDLRTAFMRLIEKAPDADTCLIAEMGDYLHYESNSYATPQSGHVLDADSRFIKMARVGIQILIDAIECALTKFKHVIIRNVIGNHAPHAEQVLSMALDLFYSNNDRVTVETTANKFYYHLFGEVLIGLTHGDGPKLDKLPGVMANDAAEEWGKSKHRYMYVGHVHHKDVKEYPGCTVETFNTLAPTDAWHRKMGYRAKQNISLIVHHKKYGEIERIVKDIRLIRDSQK